VAFSASGKWLASASADRTVRVWDVATGQSRATLEGHALPVRAAAFGPTEDLLATASMDGTVRLWDVVKGEERLTLR
jgi:WD40 repeat protein